MSKKPADAPNYSNTVHHSVASTDISASLTHEEQTATLNSRKIAGKIYDNFVAAISYMRPLTKPFSIAISGLHPRFKNSLFIPLASFIGRIIPADYEELKDHRKIYILNQGGGVSNDLEEISGDNLRVFPKGQEHLWPSQLVLCFNEAVGVKKNIAYYMLSIQRTVSNLINKPIDFLESKTELESGDIAGRAMVIGFHHTSGNIFANLANSTKRIISDIHGQSSAKAAVLLCDLLIDEEKTNESRESGRIKHSQFIIREDAPNILKRIMSFGHSEGANLATDTFLALHELLVSGAAFRIENHSNDLRCINSEIVGNMFKGAMIFATGDISRRYNKFEETFMPLKIEAQNPEDFMVNMHAYGHGQVVNHKEIVLTLGDVPWDAEAYLGHAPKPFMTALESQHRESLEKLIGPRFGQAKTSLKTKDIILQNDTIQIIMAKTTPPRVMEELVRRIQDNLSDTHANAFAEIDSKRHYCVTLKGIPDNPNRLDSLRSLLTNLGVSFTNKQPGISERYLATTPDETVTITEDSGFLSHGLMYRLSRGGKRIVATTAEEVNTERIVPSFTALVQRDNSKISDVVAEAVARRLLEHVELRTQASEEQGRRMR